jgi:uncharacterized protein (DUF1499 family)
MATSNSNSTPSTWPLTLLKWGSRMILVGLVLVLLAGPFNRLGITGFFGPLLALLFGYLVLMLGMIGALTGFMVANGRGMSFARPRSVLTILAALLVGGYITGVILGSRGLPPIHEISTDLDSPPPFVALRAIREQNPKLNPVDYVREMKNPQTGAVMNIPQLQSAAYPDILPLRLEQGPDQVFEQARSAIEALGWDIVAAVPADGRIEATDTTRFFGFKDDVVVRIRAEGSGTRVDVRSKSRVGFGDAGANAKRVRALLTRLKS